MKQIKNFSNELTKFIDKIKNHELFSLTRFHDGENYIITEQPINIINKANGEFKYDPNDYIDFENRNRLIQSLQYKSHNYHVGIMSGCCVKAGIPGHNWMEKLSNQKEENLTFATLFFNSNYERVKKELIPLFNNYDVILIGNKNADISKLPFKVFEFFKVGTNAWRNDYYDVFNQLADYLQLNQQNKMFLFCAGPLSNMLIHKLSIINDSNTYINAGSILDPYMFKEPTRWYQTDKNGHGEHTCIW